MEKRAGSFQPTRDGRELRSLRRDLAGVRREKRADDKSSIKGLAAVYYRAGDATTEYWLYWDMVERIMPGAFDRAIKEAHDARGLFNHDSSQLLGRVSSGTLMLSVTSDGLAYEIPSDPSDPDHQRVAAKIDRGDVTGSSFAFIARETSWTELKTDAGDWIYIREVKDVDLFDVGPVTWPAYEGTTAGRSSAPGADKRSVSEEVRSLIAEREKYLRQGDDEAVKMRLRRLQVG